MSGKSKNVLKGLLVGVIVLLVIVSVGGSIALHGNTIVAWWLPLTICGVMALASATVLWRIWMRLTGSVSFFPNFICQAVFAWSLLLFGFYVTNYGFASEASKHVEDVTVEGVYSKTHYKSRRVGRGRYVRGEPYKVYYMEVSLADGRLKELSVTRDESRRLRKGTVLPLTFERGFWGAPVIKRQGLHVDVPHSSYRP
ncbi:MAG: hypothetical protein HDS68_00955 [Bacteroidales bacterium]|nr:hypothetical protein [Bacteroidales bacterium]